MSVACTYSASGTHRAPVRGLSEFHLHVRQQFPLVSGAPRDKLGMREPPAPGVPPRAVAALHPPRAGPRAHGPRCACVPVAGGGGVGVQRACSPEGRAAGDCCRRCHQLPCYQLPCPRDSMCAARASHPRRAGQSAHPACAWHLSESTAPVLFLSSATTLRPFVAATLPVLFLSSCVLSSCDPSDVTLNQTRSRAASTRHIAGHHGIAWASSTTPAHGPASARTHP